MAQYADELRGGWCAEIDGRYRSKGDSECDGGMRNNRQRKEMRPHVFTICMFMARAAQWQCH